MQSYMRNNNITGNNFIHIADLLPSYCLLNHTFQNEIKLNFWSIATRAFTYW